MERRERKKHKQLKHLPVKTYHHRIDCARMRSIPYFDTRRDDACVIIIHFLLFPYALLLYGNVNRVERKELATEPGNQQIAMQWAKKKEREKRIALKLMADLEQKKIII